MSLMGSKHLTYEVVQKALADDSAAIVQIINYFDGLITHLSIRSKVDRDGTEELYVDEDIRQELIVELITKQSRFIPRI